MRFGAEGHSILLTEQADGIYIYIYIYILYCWHFVTIKLLAPIFSTGMAPNAKTYICYGSGAGVDIFRGLAPKAKTLIFRSSVVVSASSSGTSTRARPTTRAKSAMRIRSTVAGCYLIARRGL